MPSLDEVYREFGDTAEAAQLLETQLGTMLLSAKCEAEDLLSNQDPKRAKQIYQSVDRSTLGQILKSLRGHTESLNALERLLEKALDERNRLFHAFYRQHNFRRNSEDGRTIMLQDLQAIHAVLLEAYKAVMLADGIDLDTISIDKLPTNYLPI